MTTTSQTKGCPALWTFVEKFNMTFQSHHIITISMKNNKMANNFNDEDFFKTIHGIFTKKFIRLLVRI